MTLTIVGAGAIGGTVGAYLVRAGEPVRFVDQDAAHVAVMRERGLTIQGFVDISTGPLDAVTPDELPGRLDTVLLAVKAQHTEQALRTIMPLLTPTSTVVSLQNGLCERIIVAMIGAERTVGSFVNFSADYLEPGVIVYGGPGSLYLGELNGEESARIKALKQALAAWDDVKVTANIWGYLWGKMGYANMLFATALADETMADVIDRYRPLMVELASEIYAVSTLEGVRVEPFDNVEPSLFYPRENRSADEIERSFDQLIERRRRDLKTKSGIWRDLAVRRRKTEIDQQVGLVTEIGAGYGLAMPLTHALVTMIHDLEDGRRVMSWDNVEELDALRRTTYGDAAW